MIEVTISGVSMTEAGFVVFLQNRERQRALPIAIGSAEAQAILFEMNGMEFPRPLTHDLLRNLLGELGATLTRVVVTELRDSTFMAVLCLEVGTRQLEVDARPSDALALALRCRAPVYVAEAVMAVAGVPVERSPRAAAKAGAGVAGPLADLRARLERAVAEERYEEAARLRDELRERSAEQPPPSAH